MWSLCQADAAEQGPGAAGARRRASQAEAGERTAANLGGMSATSLTRGEVLVRTGELVGASIINIKLGILPVVPAAVKTRAKVLFHTLRTQASATVVLLEEAARPGPGHADGGPASPRDPVLLPGDAPVLRGFRTLPGHGARAGRRRGRPRAGARASSRQRPGGGIGASHGPGPG